MYLVDTLPCGWLELDGNGAIVEANETVAEWSGISTTELIGRVAGDILEFDAPAIDPSQPWLPGTALLSCATGRARPVLVQSAQSRRGNRTLMLFDATEQQKFATELLGEHALQQRTQQRLELVIAASIAFAEASTEQELAQVLADTTAQAFAAEEAVVYLLNENGDFEQAAGEYPFGALDDVDSLTLQARYLGNVIKISGVDEAHSLWPAVGRAFEDSGVQAMVIAPMRQEGKTFGMLGVFFHHPRTFDEQASPLADALAGQAARAIANLRLRAQLEHAATHDEATGLPNRRLLEEYLESQMRGRHDFVAVIFIDLDGFKAVNDLHGHQVGDELLREVGNRLLGVVREEDLVARYGGDEFVVVCQVTNEAAALDVADRVLASIAHPFDFVDDGFRLGASIGLSISETQAVIGGADHLLRSADQSMYSAKLAGGNRIVVETVAQ
jgi:diguanylate cyclase (GGDEF)-like protein